MLAGQKTQKKDNEMPSGDFVDLLQLQNPVAGEMPKVSQVKEGSEQSQIKNEDFQVKSKAGQTLQSQKDEYKPVSKEKEFGQTTENKQNSVNKAVDAEDSEKTDATVVSEKMSKEAAAVVADLSVDDGEISEALSFDNMPVLGMPLSPEIVTDGSEQILVNEEEINIISAEPENVSLVSENLSTVEQSAIDNQAVAEAPELMMQQPKEESDKLIAVEQNIGQKGDKQPVIQEQEEKIASMLPEDKKVEIKVSVKEDKVTSKLKNTPLSVENMEISEDPKSIEINTKEPAGTLGLQINKSKDSQNIQPIVTDVESSQIAEQQIVVSQQPHTENINVLASVQAVQPVAEGVNAVSEASNVSATKEIYTNKGLTREVAEQIKVNISQSAIKGIDKVEIQLKPADLGHVEIKLQIAKDGKLQAHIIASNAETLEILQKDASALKEAFNEAGYLTDDNNFSFSYRGDDQNTNEREKLREFIGEVITQDVAAEAAANDYISTDGVNIRV